MNELYEKVISSPFNLAETAHQWASDAHWSIAQRRKYTDEPYINHPERVAYLVEMVGGTAEMIAAAYLHDVLEDVAPVNNCYGRVEMLRNFPLVVVRMVEQLTDNSPGKNREEKKAADRDRISCASAEIKTIKLADLIDNSSTITKYDPGFARLYLKEKRLLLSVLEDGNRNLWEIADNILTRNGY